MGTALPFDFLTIRQLQKNCSYPPLPTPFSKDDSLRVRVDSAKESALSLLDDLIKENETTTSASANPDTDVLHKALLLRSEIYSKKSDLVLAKNDVERAIVLKPHFTDPYGALSMIETKRGQFGRAEVALRLGLFVDQGNDHLNKLLSSIRSVDPVHRDVCSKKGTDAAIRMEHQEAGYELVPPLPDLVMAVMTGNLAALKRMWKPALRQYRFTRVKNPLMHFPVLGAQRINILYPKGKKDMRSEEERVEEYKSVIDFLFDNGVRLDERDRVGYTAAFHASAHLPQPELLEHLLAKGADPDVRACYGTVALMDATMYQNLKELDILLKFGADPYIADNDGCKPIKIGENLRAVVAVYDRHLKPSMPAKICSRCTKAGTKRCVKCRVVYYCSRQCQLDGWPSHKARCRELCKSHKRVFISVDNPLDIKSTADYTSAKAYNLMHSHLPGFERRPDVLDLKVPDLFEAYTEEWKKSGNLLLKIQAAKKKKRVSKKLRTGDDFVPDLNADMLAYNEGKTFQCMLDPKKLDAPDLLAIIEEKGVMGIKAYFWAYMEPGKNELIVITDPIHPAQPW